MKKYYLLLLVSIFTTLSAQHEEADMKRLIGKEMQSYKKMINYNENPNTLNYDLKYQRLELDLDPFNQYVSGTVTSHFVPNQNIESIFFDLSDNLTVSEVKYHGNNLSFVQLSTKEIKIDFPSQIAAATLDSLSIKYEGSPETGGSAGDAFTTTFENGNPALFTLSEPYGAQEWFPTKQSMNDKIDKVDMIIITPAEYNVASNGKLISENLISSDYKKTFWQTNYPIPAYLIALGITNYTKFNDTIGNPPFPFVNYLYPSTANDPDVIFNINYTKNILPLFEEYFGEYPYRNEKYGHMEFGWGGGMEHATMSSMGAWSRGVIAHELAHQWFGDKVTCGAWNDIWLNEGFATFGEHLTYEKLLLNHNDFLNYLYQEKNDITSSPGGSVYVSDSNLGNVNVIFDGRLSYAKGGYVLRMLKWILGEDAFYQALKDYHNRPNLAYNYAKTGDFAASLQQSTGKDFTEFFNNWIYGQGYPRYTIRWKYDNNKMIFRVNQTTSHNSVSFFKMPLPIKVNGANGEVAYFKLDNTSNSQYFYENVGFPVISVQFNYEYQIVESNSNVIKDNSLAVNEAEEQYISIYPNPASSVLHISGITTPIDYQIFSIDGKFLLHNKGLDVDISSLSKGVYFIKLNDKNLKFIKN